VISTDRATGSLDQDVIGLEAVKFEREVGHLPTSGAQNRGAEPKPGGRNGPWQRLVQAQRDQRARVGPLFDQAKGEAGRLLRQERRHEAPIDRQPGQHWTRGWQG
jgi:hypothetical protein